MGVEKEPWEKPGEGPGQNLPGLRRDRRANGCAPFFEREK